MVKNISKGFKSGLVFSLIGLLLISISIIFHTNHLINTSNVFLLKINEIFIQLLSHLGIGAIAIGIISIILEMEHWTEYFEDRLSKIVMKKSYLKSLNNNELISLEKDLLKVHFNDNEDIDIKESFLSYYQKNIKKFIGMPYRKNVVMHLIITESKYIDPNTSIELELFKISEIMTYQCKKNGEFLQDNICYFPDNFEHFSTENYFVKIQHPSLSKHKKANNNHEIEFKYDELVNVNFINDNIKGFNLDIKEYTVDELQVMVKADYTIKKDRFIGWRMSHPTLDLTIMVDYPIEYIISKEFYFSEDNSFTYDNDNKIGRFMLKNSEWLLPDEGLTIQLTKCN
jgi:hypothetical protein